MRKTIYLLVALALVACDKDGGEGTASEPIKKVVLSKHSIEIPYRGETTLSVTGDDVANCDWESSDEFVADVSYKGNVKAWHVGTAVIYVSNGESKDSCLVTVTPINTDAYVPVIKWGISKNQLKEAETNAIETEKDSYIDYKVNGEPIYVTYQFEGGKLACSKVDINRTQLTTTDACMSLMEYFDLTTTSSSGIILQRDGCFAVIKSKGGNGGIRIFYGESLDDIKKFYSL